MSKKSNYTKNALQIMLTAIIIFLMFVLLATSCAVDEDIISFREDVVPTLRLEGTWLQTELGEKECGGDNKILNRRPVDNVTQSFVLFEDGTYLFENFSDETFMYSGTFTAFEIPARNDSYDVTFFRGSDIWYSCIVSRKNDKLIYFDYRLPDGSLECQFNEREGWVHIYSLQP